jgi:hypothetical protein
VIGALAVVDLVTAFDADSPVELLQLVRPDVYAKGGDYTPAMLPETPVVEALGGEVHILDYLADHSTSAIVARAQQPAPGAAASMSGGRWSSGTPSSTSTSQAASSGPRRTRGCPCWT